MYLEFLSSVLKELNVQWIWNRCHVCMITLLSRNVTMCTKEPFMLHWEEMLARYFLCFCKEGNSVKNCIERNELYRIVSYRTSPHITSPYFTLPHLTSPHLTSPHLTSPHLTSPHLTLPHLTVSYCIVTVLLIIFAGPHWKTLQWCGYPK